MKKLVYIAIVLAILSIKIWAGEPMSRSIPHEPLLYIEFENLSDFIQQYRDSELRNNYEDSKNYEDFTNSKLYLKLNARFEELSALIDLKVDFEVLKSLGGAKTGFALYDIGELQFVMITEVTPEKWVRSKLYDKTKYFETRTMDGITYFVKQDDGGGMSFAFGEIGRKVFISNNLEYFMEAVKLENGEEEVLNLNENENFKQFEGFINDHSNREFFLYLNQAELNRNSYFHTYWIYQNFEEISWIDRGMIFLVKDNEGLREIRYFNPAPESSGNLPDIEPLEGAYTRKGRVVSIGEFMPNSEKVLTSFFGKKTGTDKFVEELIILFKASSGDYYVFLSSPMPAEDEAFFSTNQKCLLLHYGKKINNQQEWLKLVSRYMNDQFVVSPDLSFKKAEKNLYVLEFPPVDKVYMKITDNWIGFANLAEVLDGLEYPEITVTKTPQVKYLEIDYEYLSNFTMQLIEKLVIKSNWDYFESGKFFEDNISSLIRTTSKIKFFTVEQNVQENLLREEVNYFYQK